MRSRRLVCLSVIGFAAGLPVVASARADEAERVTVRVEDNGQPLVNPDMGWTMHFYSNIIANYGSKLDPADTLDDFPGLSTVYLRLPWSFLEPDEGRFDWSVVDTPAQRFISQGKKVAFRISCCESWMRYATPQWVEEAGAKGHNFTVGRGVDDNGPFWEPVYDDPVFLEKLEHFLGEFSRRYDGNPNVAFIVFVGVDDGFNMRELPVGPPGEAPTRKLRATFTMARVFKDGPRRFARSAAAGTYDVFVSVGTLDGTPRIALPLEGDDRQQRYRVGKVVVAREKPTP